MLGALLPVRRVKPLNYSLSASLKQPTRRYAVERAIYYTGASHRRLGDFSQSVASSRWNARRRGSRTWASGGCV